MQRYPLLEKPMKGMKQHHTLELRHKDLDKRDMIAFTTTIAV